MSFRVEFVGVTPKPGDRPLEFETQAELDQWLTFIRGCPVDDGPVQLRITEVQPVTTRVVTLNPTCTCSPILPWDADFCPRHG